MESENNEIKEPCFATRILHSVMFLLSFLENFQENSFVKQFWHFVLLLFYWILINLYNKLFSSWKEEGEVLNWFLV